MTLKLSQTTNDTLEVCTSWLTNSELIMTAIEEELLPTLTQLRTVGVEWAGTVSRLGRTH